MCTCSYWKILIGQFYFVIADKVIHDFVATYLFVVLNSDALAQASDFLIERSETSCLTLLYEGFEPRKSETPNRQQTECPFTNRLSYQGSSLNLELDIPSLSWASIQPTWLHCRLAFAPGSGNIHLLLIWMLWHRQANFESKRNKLVSSAECRIRTLEVWDTKSTADWMPTH